MFDLLCSKNRNYIIGRINGQWPPAQHNRMDHE